MSADEPAVPSEPVLTERLQVGGADGGGAGNVLLITLNRPEVRNAVNAGLAAGVAGALDDQDEQRLARETARLMRLGADPVDAVRRALAWSADRLEFGMTHAYAAAPDWLAQILFPGFDPEAEAAVDRPVDLVGFRYVV